MKTESSSTMKAGLKAWSVCETQKTEVSHDLSIACLSFIVLLFVAVADAALKM